MSKSTYLSPALQSSLPSLFYNEDKHTEVAANSKSQEQVSMETPVVVYNGGTGGMVSTDIWNTNLALPHHQDFLVTDIYE